MSTPEDRFPPPESGDTEHATAFVRRAPRISQADVFRAADELLVEGNRPTIDRVRMRLGRGSPNTINDHLDAWWAKLGSRLRDIPGHEFPQLPERIAKVLQHLWNEALEGARETLQQTMREHEAAMAQREQALETRAAELAEREHAAAIRSAALEESLTLVREQLAAAGRGAERLEGTLNEREAECGRLRARVESLETLATGLRSQLDASTEAFQRERTQRQEHYAATERHWVSEVDRARLAARDSAREHERATRELLEQRGALEAERNQLRHKLVEAHAELRGADAARRQLEVRLRLRPDPDQPRKPGTWRRPGFRGAPHGK
jgi:hypothetical protein